MSWRPLSTPEECERRLEFIFPRSAFDTVLANPLAAWSVAALLYVDSVVPIGGPPPPNATWARPTTVLWLSYEIYQRDDAVSRRAWRDAALGGNAKRRVAELEQSWGVTFNPRYGDNSREQLRDETWPKWLDEGAVTVKPGVKKTSPSPRWALTDAFADLFAPELNDEAFRSAVDSFRDTYMSPSGRVKVLTARQRGDRAHAVQVTLPGGDVRQLEPGESSVILKGVLEQWAPRRLSDAVVLTISEPGEKVYTADAATIRRLGLAIDPTSLLPDAVLVDIGPKDTEFWIVEAVASDGVIDEDRKRRLEAWAAEQRIPPQSCRYLTAFGSRNAAPAKRRLKDLAAGTFAWFADEPGHELAWYEL